MRSCGGRSRHAIRFRPFPPSGRRVAAADACTSIERQRESIHVLYSSASRWAAGRRRSSAAGSSAAAAVMMIPAAAAAAAMASSRPASTHHEPLQPRLPHNMHMYPAGRDFRALPAAALPAGRSRTAALTRHPGPRLPRGRAPRASPPPATASPSRPPATRTPPRWHSRASRHAENKVYFGTLTAIADWEARAIAGDTAESVARILDGLHAKRRVLIDAGVRTEARREVRYTTELMTDRKQRSRPTESRGPAPTHRSE